MQQPETLPGKATENDVTMITVYSMGYGICLRAHALCAAMTPLVRPAVWSVVLHGTPRMT